MKRNGINKYLVLIILIMMIGVGYAYITVNLGIDGTARIGDDDVFVRYKNVTKTNNANIDPESGPSISGSKNDVLSYTVVLDKNETYEFTADLVNLGANIAVIEGIEAKISIDGGEETTDIPAYIDLSIVNNDDSQIQANHELAKEASEKIKNTIKLKNNISDENYNSIKDKEIVITLTIKYHKKDTPAINFATSSWSDIIAAYNDNNITELEQAMNAGTTREIPLDLDNDGTNEEKCLLRIANLSKPSECSTTGFSQTACGFVLECANSITYHTMNSTNTNVGGWPASEMRTYLNSTVYNAIPSDLKNKIITTYTVSGHEQDATDNYVTQDDYLYLLSLKEVGIDSTGETATTETRILDFYNLNNVDSTRVKEYPIGYIHWYWLRTASVKNNEEFIVILDNGSNARINANYDNDNIPGVSPAFRIAAKTN